MYDVNEYSRNSDVSDAMPGNKNLGHSINAAPPLGVGGESPGLQRGHIPHLDGEQETSPRMQLDLNNLMKEKLPTKETFKPNIVQRAAGLAGNLRRRSLSVEQEQEVVDVHDAIRRNVSPPGSNLMKMRYSQELASQAQAHADSCVMQHSGLASENMFFSSGTTIDLSAAIYAWEKEKLDYDYDTDTCKEGKVCGHYTQVVWASSVEVGCGASNQCGGTYKTHIVCQYSPSGNYVGIRPYKKGAPWPVVGVRPVGIPVWTDCVSR
ncbi:uncharacterized protein LOC144627388 [Crassostrea virginica]